MRRERARDVPDRAGRVPAGRLPAGQAPARRALAGWVIPAVIALISFGCGGEPAAPTVRSTDYLALLEGESFVEQHDGGGSAVASTYCSSASNEHAVLGVDEEGDWIEMRFVLEKTEAFVDSIRSAGLPGERRSWQIEYRREGDATVLSNESVTTIEGTGIH